MMTPAERKKERLYPVFQHNKLIQEIRVSLGLFDIKVLTRIQQKITPSMTINDPIEFDIREFCRMCAINPNSGANYNNVRKSILNLKERSGWIPKVKKVGEDLIVETDAKGRPIETTFSWISRAELRRGEGRVLIWLDPALDPFLYGLSKNYTITKGISIFILQHKSSALLYSYFRSYVNIPTQRKPYEVLRDKVGGTYKTFGQFNAKALKHAVEEINQLTDITVTYTVKNIGKQVYIDFHVARKSELDRAYIEQSNNKELEGQLALYEPDY